MHVFEKNIKDLDLIIPDLATPVANYVPYKIIEKLVYVSGQAPVKDNQIAFTGKVGLDISEEDGIKAAELCCINIIAALKNALKNDWERLQRAIQAIQDDKASVTIWTKRKDLNKWLILTKKIDAVNEIINERQNEII